MSLSLPPLALYIHIPWCVQKCPYCDFNSHGLKQDIPEQVYVSHLLDDLRLDAAMVNGRTVSSIFIGGGTPSLFSPQAINTLLEGVRNIVDLSATAEITLEANPGTVESEKFNGFSQAGVNRLSIGIQTFEQQQLHALGRIHDKQQALNAAGYARAANLRGFNLDLMHGLPDQTVEQALSDLDTAINQQPPHLSWYQLTIEPNTLFYSNPPELPEDDILWEIQDQGQELLAKAGYQQYEISGYAKPGFECQHNLNYWRFGDYLGIGCGAHGKITQGNDIIRTVKVKHPKGYMDLTRPYLDKRHNVELEDRPFEFFMNRLRLVEGFNISEFEAFTGISAEKISAPINQAIDQGLMQQNKGQWKTTAHGIRYLNSLLTLFTD